MATKVYSDGDVADVLPSATPWQRYWSRMLDLILEMIVCAYLLGALAPKFFLSISENDLLLALALIPLALLLDAIILAAFQQTLGKLIVGARVTRENGDRVTFLEALHRNVILYVHGLGLGIPIVSLFTLVSSYSKVKNGETLRWDEISETQVYSPSQSLPRTVATALLYLFLVGGLSAWDTIERQEIDDQMPRAEPFADRDPIEDQLRQGALEQKRDLPTRLDEITTLKDVTVSGRQMIYHFAISRRDASDAELSNFLRKSISDQVCGDSAMKEGIKDFGITYRYDYDLPGRDTPLSILIDADSCSQ